MLTFGCHDILWRPRVPAGNTGYHIGLAGYNHGHRPDIEGNFAGYSFGQRNMKVFDQKAAV